MNWMRSGVAENSKRGSHTIAMNSSTLSLA
jgi:hypothetical protein